MLSILLGPFVLANVALAATTCFTDLQPTYPYCISVPDNVKKGQLLPTVLMMSGRGARGPPSDVQSLATYDGFAKLVNQYENGNTDEAHTLAATKFITIVPIAPLSLANADPQYWYPECLSKVIADVKSKGYAIDWDRFHSVGYSMGAFSSWRFSTAYPDMVATVIASGGNAETNVITNTLGQQATPPADLLSGIVKRKIPIRSFTGTQDTTIPSSWLVQTQDSLEALGAGSLAKLTILDTDHTGLSTIPFDANLLNWMLQQKRPGSSSKKSSSGKKTSSKTKKPKTKSSSGKSSAKTPTSSSGKKKCTPAQKARRAAKRQLDMGHKRHGL